MRYLPVLTLTALLVRPLSAQEWTVEQQEVSDFELGCAAMTAGERLSQCFHEAYIGWYAGDPVPVDLAGLRAGEPYWGEDAKFVTARPLAITVLDDIAVVHFMLQYAIPEGDGSMALEWFRWTDVLLKVGDRWGWIADAGGEVKLYGRAVAQEN